MAPHFFSSDARRGAAQLDVARPIPENRLGELCSRSDRQALQFYVYTIMLQIVLLPDDQEVT